MQALKEKQALKDKVAVITGGSTGIGFATAKLFLEEGARVVLTGRTQETLDTALAELDEPDRAVGVRGDVARLNDLDRLFATVKERFGRIDVSSPTPASRASRRWTRWTRRSSTPFST